MEPILANFSPEAQKYIQVLRALNYLRPEISEHLFKKILHHNRHSNQIELEELKRYVAIVFFDHRETLPPRTQNFIHKDWKMLFS